MCKLFLKEVLPEETSKEVGEVGHGRERSQHMGKPSGSPAEVSLAWCCQEPRRVSSSRSWPELKRVGLHTPAAVSQGLSAILKRGVWTQTPRLSALYPCIHIALVVSGQASEKKRY